MLTVDHTFMPALVHDADFSLDSRLWFYPCERELTAEETQFVENQLLNFCKNWTAHNHALRATAEVFQNRLLILMVDETQADASGCSIDKSVHFLETLGRELDTHFFDRMIFGWVDDYHVRFAPREAVAEAVASGKIHAETLMLNTLCQTRGQMLDHWLVPFSQSWHRRLV